MLHQLSWPTLQIRWKISMLQLCHKIFYHQISLSIPPYYLSITRDTQNYHPISLYPSCITSTQLKNGITYQHLYLTQLTLIHLHIANLQLHLLYCTFVIFSPGHLSAVTAVDCPVYDK